MKRMEREREREREKEGERKDANLLSLFRIRMCALADKGQRIVKKVGEWYCSISKGQTTGITTSTRRELSTPGCKRVQNFILENCIFSAHTLVSRSSQSF